MMTKYKVIRNWNETECINQRIVFDENGKPIGCEVEDIYSGEKSVLEDYTFELLADEKN